MLRSYNMPPTLHPTANKRKPNSASLLAVASVLVTFLSGCASAPGSPATASSTSPEALQARAVQRSTDRWKALLDKRYDDAFAFYSPASRRGQSASDFSAAMQRMGYLAARVEGAVCKEDTCTVHSSVTLSVAVPRVGARPQTVPVEETWVVGDGEVWLIRR